MSRFIDWFFSPMIKAKEVKNCEDCFYYRYEENHPEYFKFCGICLEAKNKPNFHPKGDSQ